MKVARTTKEFRFHHVIKVLAKLGHDGRRSTSALIVEELFNILPNEHFSVSEGVAALVNRPCHSFLQRADVEATNTVMLFNVTSYPSRHGQVDQDEGPGPVANRVTGYHGCGDVGGYEDHVSVRNV